MEYRNFVDDGYTLIWKRSDDDYVVSKTGIGYEGYDIPRGMEDLAYSFDDAETYWNENPDKRYEFVPSREDTLINELRSIESYLSSKEILLARISLGTVDRNDYLDEIQEIDDNLQRKESIINELKEI